MNPVEYHPTVMRCLYLRRWQYSDSFEQRNSRASPDRMLLVQEPGVGIAPTGAGQTLRNTR